MLIINSSVFIILLLITWQDFKYRAVYWWLFVVLMLVLGMIKYVATSAAMLGEHLLYNGTFLGVQLLFLSLYFSVKERKWVNIFEEYFGLGDLFFLLSITVYFSFLNYLCFYLLSLFVVILVSLANQLVVKKPNPQIPLAGYQSLLMFIFMVVDHYSNPVNLYSDHWFNIYLKF